MSKKKLSQVIPITVVVVAVLVGAWFWYSSADTINSKSESVNVNDELYTPVASDITKGNPQAKAVLIEYGDFQCSACRLMHERFRAVWRVVQDDLYLVYRHFPLNQHSHARMTSRYSEAMNRQGKFWEFHDLLYDNQEKWDNLSSQDAQKMFEEFVVRAGGDIEKFHSDLKDPAIDRKIDRDMKLGERSGLRGTPTLILNGNKIDIPNNLGKFVSDIKDLNRP